MSTLVITGRGKLAQLQELQNIIVDEQRRAEEMRSNFYLDVPDDFIPIYNVCEMYHGEQQKERT